MLTYTPIGAEGRFTPFRTVILMTVIGLLLIEVAFGHTAAFLMLNGLHAPQWDAAMLRLTDLSDPLIIGGIVAAIIGRRQPALILVLIPLILLGDVMISALKSGLFADIARPLKVLGEYAVHAPGKQPLEQSFPSGSSFRVAFGMSLLSAGAFQLGRWQWPAEALAIALTLVVAYSRIYLGLHFPVDVAVGLTLGLLFGWVGQLMLPRIANALLMRLPGNFIRPLGLIIQLAGVGVVLATLSLKWG